VVFPGEPHGPRKLTHQMRKVEEEVAWFDKYFFKTNKLEGEAVKKDSPLEAELRRKNIARVSGGYYGMALKRPKNVEVLTVVPEMVKRGDLEISRFEVTRSQFAACQKTAQRQHTKAESASPTPAESDRYLLEINLPASGVSLDQARQCAARLSELTGQQWRIPYEDEVKSLYEKRDGENTLDYWAGYAANPEDTAKLREAAKKLIGTAPLLKEVGSFHGQGKDDEEPIYDVGGNVAEWVLTRDGKGKVIGGSADCPADAKANCTPAPEYVGFRVVRGDAKPAKPGTQ